MNRRTTTRLLFVILMVTNTMEMLGQDIHRVACDGNLQKLDSMLQYTDLHIPDDRGRSLLHWAVGCDKKEVFDYLVNRGMEINKPDTDGYIPLYVAIQFNRTSLFDTLLVLQEDDDWLRRFGASLIGKAILDKKLNYVQKLVEAGVDVEILNEQGSSPLEISRKVGVDEIADYLIAQGADTTKVRSFTARGEYMGQSLPGTTKAVFAPNFISTEQYEFGSVFSENGTEFYYAIATSNHAIIKYSKLLNGEWTQPKTILSNEAYGYNDPFLSPDENRLYFISKKPLEDNGEPKFDHDIWYVEREGDGWSEPINAGPNINSERNEYYISFTITGTMYFASNINAPDERKNYDQDIYYSEYVDGEFQKPVRLGNAINTEHYEADVFVAPDESYLIFCATRPDGMGRGDLYVSFKDDEGNWSKSVNMGDVVNTQGHELCPFVTSDGKFLLYTSNEDIYWISTEILKELR